MRKVTSKRVVIAYMFCILSALCNMLCGFVLKSQDVRKKHPLILFLKIPVWATVLFLMKLF